MTTQTDILILGAGIAGLITAIKCAERYPERSILMLTKAEDEKESNTRYAQGGVAAVWDASHDDFEKHIADTLTTGDGLCREDIVRLVVETGPDRLRELIDWDIHFDRGSGDGNYELRREGGHSEKRILYHKDITGSELVRGLWEKAKQYKNIQSLSSHFAMDFITQHHLGYQVTRITDDIECYGVYALNIHTGVIETILSRVTICCTGGIGQLYKTTTNPAVATGDGIAMAHRAKGRIEDMEFVQFHPTALYTPERKRGSAFLISEAVRGAGAELKTPDGKAFMKQYDTRGSLASRDIVARAIDAEMKKYGAECMFLDCSPIGETTFRAEFPSIYEHCMALGIDPLKDMIPVAPACHYLCGGIRVDDTGRSSIHRLFAIGECASTGLHGANRLASNSLLECMVFSHRAYEQITKDIADYDYRTDVPDWDATGTADPKEMVLITQARHELQDVMSNYVGIVRSNLRLQRARDRLYLLFKETEELYQTTTLSPQLAELRNLITIGYLITRAAIHRQESRGLHYNTDYLEKLPFLQHSVQ